MVREVVSLVGLSLCVMSPLIRLQTIKKIEPVVWDGLNDRASWAVRIWTVYCISEPVIMLLVSTGLRKARGVMEANMQLVHGSKDMMSRECTWSTGVTAFFLLELPAFFVRLLFVLFADDLNGLISATR
jgi:hypothetical protein